MADVYHLFLYAGTTSAVTQSLPAGIVPVIIITNPTI